jgi:hypothetical protein
MTAEQFGTETSMIINENHKALVDCYVQNGKEDSGALLLQLFNDELKYYYISETKNKVLYDKLEPFMLERIKANPEKIYIACFGENSLVACHFLSNDIPVPNN